MGPYITSLSIFLWKIKCPSNLRHFVWHALSECLPPGRIYEPEESNVTNHVAMMMWNLLIIWCSNVHYLNIFVFLYNYYLTKISSHNILYSNMITYSRGYTMLIWLRLFHRYYDISEKNQKNKLYSSMDRDSMDILKLENRSLFCRKRPKQNHKERIVQFRLGLHWESETHVISLWPLHANSKTLEVSFEMTNA